MSLSQLEVDVLWVGLHPLNWRTFFEIADKVCDERRGRFWGGLISLCTPRKWSTFLLTPGSGSLYPVLAKFEELKWVESLWREEPAEVTAKRGGNRLREYRVIYSALRKSRKKRTEILLGTPVPHGA